MIRSLHSHLRILNENPFVNLPQQNCDSCDSNRTEQPQRQLAMVRSKQQHSRMHIMTQLRVLSMRIAEVSWFGGRTAGIERFSFSHMENLKTFPKHPKTVKTVAKPMRSMSSRLSRWFLPRFPGVIMSILCYLPKDERWQDGVTQAMSEKLGIHESMQREGLHISEAPDFLTIAAHHSEKYRGMPGYPWAIHVYNHFTIKLCTTVTTSLCFNRFVMFTDSVDVEKSGNRNPLPNVYPAQFSASFIKGLVATARQPTDKKWNILAVFLA